QTRQPRLGHFAAGLPDQVSVRPADGELVARAHARADGRLLAAPADDLDDLLVELRPAQAVDDRAAVLLEDRLGGPERDVREPVGRDARRGGHARTDARVALVENQAEIEVSDRRPARREVDARQHRDEIDARGEVLAGHGLDADGRGLPHLQTAAIRLVEPRLEMDRRQAGQLPNARAGPRAVALAELDAAAERPSRARILEDVDGAVGRRPEHELLDRGVGAIHVEGRLVALPDLADQLGVGAGFRRHLFRLNFLQPLLGVGERQLRGLVLDARDEIALAQIELRALDVVPRLHQRRLLLLGGGLRLRPGL